MTDYVSAATRDNGVHGKEFVLLCLFYCGRIRQPQHDAPKKAIGVIILEGVYRYVSYP